MSCKILHSISLITSNARNVLLSLETLIIEEETEDLTWELRLNYITKQNGEHTEGLLNWKILSTFLFVCVKGFIKKYKNLGRAGKEISCVFVTLCKILPSPTFISFAEYEAGKTSRNENLKVFQQCGERSSTLRCIIRVLIGIFASTKTHLRPKHIHWQTTKSIHVLDVTKAGWSLCRVLHVHFVSCISAKSYTRKVGFQIYFKNMTRRRF